MRIDWTEPALLDLENIRSYIQKDSEYYAIQFIEKILETVENLKEFPEMGRNIPESQSKNIRELLYHNYRIIYKIEPERLLILAIIHGARDFDKKNPQPWEIL